MVYKAPELIEVWTELEYLKMTMQKPYLWMFKGFMFNIIKCIRYYKLAMNYFFYFTLISQD